MNSVIKGLACVSLTFNRGGEMMDFSLSEFYQFILAAMGIVFTYLAKRKKKPDDKTKK